MAYIEPQDIELKYFAPLKAWTCYFRGEECELTVLKDKVTLKSLDLDITIGTTDMETVLRKIKSSDAPTDIKVQTVITYMAVAQGRDPLELMRAKLKT